MCVASSWGEHLRVTIFRESHGPQVGVVLEGLPPGKRWIRRNPSPFRKARTWCFAVVHIQAGGRCLYHRPGLHQGRTTGTPLCAYFTNKDARSQDYTQFARLPRPSHADYTGLMRSAGANDPRGGGIFRAGSPRPFVWREPSACRCSKGEELPYMEGSHRSGRSWTHRWIWPGQIWLCSRNLLRRIFRVIDGAKGREMIAAIEATRRRGDSLGGMVQAFVLGLPPGLGDSIFGGVESRAAAILYGIPAVKGVSFGAGFAVCGRRGSENNDPFCLEKGRVRTVTNNDGGLSGGITNGMPVVVNSGHQTNAIHRPPSADGRLGAGQGRDAHHHRAP